MKKASILCALLCIALVGCASKQTMPTENYQYFGLMGALIAKCRSQGMLSAYEEAQISDVVRTSINLWEYDTEKLTWYMQTKLNTTGNPTEMDCQDKLRAETYKLQKSNDRYYSHTTEQNTAAQKALDDMNKRSNNSTNKTTFCDSVGTFSYCY